MKKCLISTATIFTLLSFNSFANSVSTSIIEGEEIENTYSFDEKNRDETITIRRRALRRVKMLINENRLDEAVDKINRLLRYSDTDPSPQPGTNFSMLGLVYKQYDSNFRCNNVDKDRAIRIAKNAAMNRCYNAGKTSCRVLNTYIKANGFLGSINGKFYGFGCSAEAIVRGR
jgi:hypothetical protein